MFAPLLQMFSEKSRNENEYLNFYFILVPPYTQEEMQILNIPLDKRDYCAHYFRALMLCSQQYWPSHYGYCEPERHAWEQCQIQK
jgi:hypothetical protein